MILPWLWNGSLHSNIEENTQTAISNCRYLIKVTYYQQEGVLIIDSASYRDPLWCHWPDLVRILIHLKRPYYKNIRGSVQDHLHIYYHDRVGS